MLPESKADFPKLLYLDQNKWIDLSRAHYGRTAGEPFKDALSAIQKAVESGKLLVPFSAVNTVELEGDHDPDRRERLVKFMVELSKNNSILPIINVRPWEVQNEVHQRYSNRRPFIIRKSIVRTGVTFSIGIELKLTPTSAASDEQLLQYLNSSEFSVRYLLDKAKERETYSSMKEMEKQNLSFQEDVRASALSRISTEQRMIAEITDHIQHSDVGVSLVKALDEFGVSLHSFLHSFKNGAEFVDFFRRVSALDVLLTLTIARDRDTVKPIDVNDSRDLIGLSVALPYSNIVIMENYWCHMVKAQKLNEKYETIVTKDVRELPSILRSLNCI